MKRYTAVFLAALMAVMVCTGCNTGCKKKSESNTTEPKVSASVEDFKNDIIKIGNWNVYVYTQSGQELKRYSVHNTFILNISDLGAVVFKTDDGKRVVIKNSPVIIEEF